MNELYKISHSDFTDAACSWSVVSATTSSRKATHCQGHCHTTSTDFFHLHIYLYHNAEVLQLLHLYCIHDLQKSSFVKSVHGTCCCIVAF